MATIDERERYGPWALITGASQGIGRGFAEECARRGYCLVLVARRQNLLDAAADELHESYGIECRTLALDLTDPGSPARIIEACSDIDIGMLINNAAFAVPGEFLASTTAALEKHININVTAVTMLCHHFGALMKDRQRGAIINVSSRAGEVAIPWYAMYSGTKSFVSLFTEALWYELRAHGVDVLALKPCQTATEGYLAMNPTNKGEGIQSVEDCVREAFEALGSHPSWLPWPPSRDEVRHLRSLPPAEAITINAKSIEQAFAPGAED